MRVTKAITDLKYLVVLHIQKTFSLLTNCFLFILECIIVKNFCQQYIKKTPLNYTSLHQFC